MKSLSRSLLLAILALGGLAAPAAFAAKDVVFAVASTFTTAISFHANE